MLILIILLACLVSILVITLLNIKKINSQIILFLAILVSMVLFKLLLNRMIDTNNHNPISKNIISNINIDNQTPKDSTTDILNIINHVNNQVNVSNNNSNNNKVPTTNNQVNLSNNNNHINANNVELNKIPTTNNQVNQMNSQVNQINNQVNQITNFTDLDNDTININLKNIGSKVINVNTNKNLDLDKVSEIPKNSPCHNCLLENCPCETIEQRTCCNSIDTNLTPCGNCPTSDFLNGKKVNEECIKNNTINYADVFNQDATKKNVNNSRVPKTDCAFDSSCVTPAYTGTLHFSAPNVSNNLSQFWGNENNSQEYIQKRVPNFDCN
jgi:hypothetical protein